MRWINARASERLDRLVLELTVLGDPSVIAMLMLVSSGLLRVSRHVEPFVRVSPADIG